MPPYCSVYKEGRIFMQDMKNLFFILSFLTSAAAFLFALYLYLWVKKQKVENNEIIRVSRLIKEGAETFMRREYKLLGAFALAVSVVILIILPKPIWQGSVLTNIAMVISYIAGTILSAIAGKIGIMVATLSNGRTAEAAERGLKDAFLVGFRGGAVMGLLVVGCSLFGVAAVLMLVGDTSILLGFSFGASSLALFAKAGGGIFTKTADVSADLTGKVELGIAEDDPRNPAVIADNVGDNVGDVAGMGADLFDSNVAAMTSALVIASSLGSLVYRNIEMVFCYAILGLLSSIIGIATARVGKDGNPTKALNSSTYVTTAIFLVLTAAATALIEGFSWRIWGSSATGLIVGIIIGLTTDYFTGYEAYSKKGCPRIRIRTGVHNPLRHFIRIHIRIPRNGRNRNLGTYLIQALRTSWRGIRDIRHSNGRCRNALDSRHDHLKRCIRTCRRQCKGPCGDGRTGRGDD